MRLFAEDREILANGVPIYVATRATFLRNSELILHGDCFVAQDLLNNCQEMESQSTLTGAELVVEMWNTIQTAQRFGGKHAQAEPVEIWKARNLIDEQFEEELSLSQIAKAVNLSPNHLSEKFKQVTGTNFVKYIARRRFEKAQVLLHDSNLRVSEIAFAVGFQSLSQFNRVFKKLSGKSPTEYRTAEANRAPNRSSRMQKRK